MRNILAAVLLLISVNAQAKLLDKILAVIDDEVITKSLVDRVKSNLTARKNISPVIFNKDKMTDREVVQLQIQRILIRDRLSEMGYVISDDQVEAQIKSTEKRLGLNRDALFNFLRGNGISFDEYFEIIRESIEFNIFSGRIIRPLVTITDQEIKNAFYKKNASNKTLSFKYNLVDFAIDKSSTSKDMLKDFRGVMKKFQVNGTLPERFKDLQTNDLGQIAEDGLTKQLKTLLKSTDEGDFSKPILLGGQYHVFYVKKKDLVESEIFLRAKQQIEAELFAKAALQMTDLWYKREESKHFIKYFF